MSTPFNGEVFPLNEEPYSSQKQDASTYIDAPAALPDDVSPFDCDHDANPPVCQCVHDWRIHWGNMPKRSQSRAIYLTGA